MTDILNPTVLGQQIVEFPGTLDSIGVSPGTLQLVYTSDEVTARCPVTGQPDFYTVDITIDPDRLGIESKSLKLFLQSFHDEGIFAEALAHKIATRVLEDILPTSVSVTTHQKSRGGITITSTVYLTIHKFEGE